MPAVSPAAGRPLAAAPSRSSSRSSFRSWFLAGSLGVLPWLLAACGGGGDDASPPPAQPGAAVDATAAATPTDGASSTPVRASAAPTRRPLDVTLERADWLEPVVTSATAAGATGARPLVAGRTVTLRVLLRASEALPLSVGIEVRDAKGNLLNPAAALMQGPPTAPTGAPGPVAWGYRTTLAADWVRPGLTVRVVADPGGQYEDPTPADAQLRLAPTVARAQVMRLTVVPVVVAGETPLLPGEEDVRESLLASYPLSDVQVTRRAPYVSTSVTSPITSAGEAAADAWGKLLSELSALRRMEARAGQRYYGFVPKQELSGVMGIGYVPGLTAVGRAPRAPGQSAWRDTFLHEVGHNLDRPHSPCGTEGESAFPHAGALLGSWGYDRRSGVFLDPTATRDLMSYCGPSWVSDWTYDQVHAHLARHPLDDLGGTSTAAGDTGAASARRAGSTASATPDGASTSEQPVWLVQGRLEQGRVTVEALTPFIGEPEADGGSHRLTLVFADGRSRSLRFTPQRVDHAHDDGQFAVAVPALGAVSALQLHRGDRLLHQQAVLALSGAGTASTSASVSRPSSVASSSRAPEWRTDATGWTVHWDAQRWPQATITHVGREKTVLAVRAGGGQWQGGAISTAAAGSAGLLEVVLSDGSAFEVHRLQPGGGAGRR